MRWLDSCRFAGSVSSGRVSRGFSAFVAFVLSLFMLLVGALVVERASADGLELGPDGYFSKMNDGALPVIEEDAKTSTAQDGWVNTRRILFGKQKNTTAAEDPGGSTYGGHKVSGGYKTLAKGAVASESGKSFYESDDSGWTKSSTTSVAADEVLLWADDVVTAGFAFKTNSTYQNSFDSATNSYKSNLAQVSDEVGSQNYSSFEQDLLSANARSVEGVCTASRSKGCGSGSEPVTDPVGSFSVNAYKVFPLSIGDVNKYFGHTSGYSSDANLRCKTHIDAGNSGTCANSASGSWLRSALWTSSNHAFYVRNGGAPDYSITSYDGLGLRPALRLNVDNLLLSADSGDQGQSASGDVRLTFVDASAGSLTGASAVVGRNRLTLSGAHGLSDGFGFKIVDPAEPTKVVASGLSSTGVVDVSGLPGVKSDTAYDVYWWGQENGSAAEGWSNRATEPQKATLTFTVPSYAIELTGTTAGTLTAYRIGDYAQTVFDHTGALKSVKLDTPSGLGTVLKDAAESAGGSNVDTGNPAGWVASQWLGYPTDPPTDDVTSAYSPYAGKLQLFARALAEDTSVLTAELEPLNGLSGGPTPLKVSGPGLYLIVDSSGTSLPIIVGTKVFNEALGDEGRFVDFADAGVKGKPRLGQAALKTTVTDIAKRIVNDAGMDGFDVGSSVEYEIALQVPDLTGFTVSYASYVFDVSDVAEAGLTLPAASEVKVYMDAPSPDTEVTGLLPSSSITVSGQKLTVEGLKLLFAESSGSGVKNKDSVPVGSLMRIRYAAVLNEEHAVYAAPTSGTVAANVNEATLTRTKSDGTAESKTVFANVYSFRVELSKRDKDDVSKKLGGAQFEVSRDGRLLKFVGADGVYRLAVAGETGSSATVVTKADGTLSLSGVEARELAFEEIAAPSGYFAVSDFGVDILPEWDADATQVTKVTYATSGTNLAYVSQDGGQVVVLDPAWSLANLPYTGGIGILVLLIVGALILAFAVRPYVLSKRAEATANLI